MELHEERAKEVGQRKADLIFIRDVLLLFRPSIIKPADGTYRLTNYGMFKNYFKVGIRNILKYKMFSFINVFGLAVAMSVCMLIILMLADQKSYDQFHAKKDRIYRILGKPFKGSGSYATTAYPLNAALEETYPIFDETLSIRYGVGGDASYNKKTVELRGLFTDNSFFRVFDFPLINGDKATALSAANTMILTKEKAYQLFNTENPIGKHVQFDDRGLNIKGFEGETPPVDWGLYKIVGIIDMSQVKSHLKFDVLISTPSLPALSNADMLEDVSQKWDSYLSTFSYVLLKEGVTQRDLDKSLKEISKTKYVEIDGLEEFMLSSQSINRITPGMIVINEATFRLPQEPYYVLTLMALVIMVMACLNYVNLSIARSLARMKEIGIRKVTGATRKNLIYQFLTESVVTVMISLFVAGSILLFLEEAFMDLWVNQYLNFDLSASAPIYLTFIAFALVVGILAGIYPALFLSKREPVNSLKSGSVMPVGKLGLKKALNVSQLVFSMIFIVTSMMVYNQFKHYINYEYGFNPKNIVNVQLQNNDYDLVLNELSTVPGVVKISASEYLPVTPNTNEINLVNPETEEEYLELQYLPASEHFLENLSLSIIAGKGLPVSGSAGLNKFVVINESAVSKLGFQSPQESTGKIFQTKHDKQSLQISGVVKNFRASMLIGEDEIAPLVLKNDQASFKYLNIQIDGTNSMTTVSDLEEKWKSIDPGQEFKYDFYDDELANTHQGIYDVVSVIGYISFLSILIACLGLLGMATYTTERRTKEIGIRKVLGAGEMKIVMNLSRGFLKLLIIAVVIAAPLSFLFNTLWLNNFPNRVDFGFGTVLLGSLLLLTLGLITIGSQTIKASRRNPVESLKYE